MATINDFTNGIFQVDSSGKVNIDYLYDGGDYQGELAIFSLQGMEHLEIGSEEFMTEAANRALSNSELGYVTITDSTESARFNNLNNELSWEGQFDRGTYNGKQTFQMQEGDRFAMMLVSNGTVTDVATNPNIDEVLFSFDTLELDNGKTIGQIADVTGDGSTFGWEDVNLTDTANLDRDYNDLVFQVQGASAIATTVEDSIYYNRDWLNTGVGQELQEYANIPQFENGTFTVNSTGRLTLDYLYDGGWYQGELAVFSLKGMEVYEPGSIEFLREATSRALSDSEKGRVLISDSTEGAHFRDTVTWEKDFNIDSQNYQQVSSFNMTPGDELAFMLVQHTTIEDINQHPYSTSQWGKKVLFSTDINQVTAVDNYGTLAFEDTQIASGNADYDYNDFVFQVRGLESDNTVSIDEAINPNRDWRKTEVGQELLDYTSQPQFDTGVFEVGETGKVTFDYLFDGGWYEGELAVFSLEGMDVFEPGSIDFLKEATRRALSDSEQGRVLISDATEKALFGDTLSWEKDFNADGAAYQQGRSFDMTAGDQLAFMLVQHTTIEDINQHPYSTSQWGKKVLFSTDTNQVAVIDKNGTLAFEDTQIASGNADYDYNDFVFQVKGLESNNTASVDEVINFNRDWRNTDVGQELLEYSSQPQFDTGTFIVDASGEVEFDYLFDGGWYEGELAVFSLKGMEVFEPGSIEFLDEATSRALSNSEQGRILISDHIEGAHFSDTLLNWEKDFNADAQNYQGVRSFNMEAGDELAFMLVQHTTIQDINEHPYSTSQWGKKVLFSTDTNQIAAVDNNGTLAFEDIMIASGNADYDYNDFIFQVRGLESNNTVSIDDVINPNRDWRNMGIGQDLLEYVNQPDFD